MIRFVFNVCHCYASDVWLKTVKTKSTYVNQLNWIQHRFITAATGAYRCTSRLKLLKLIGLPELVDELDLVKEKRQLELPDRREFVDMRRREMVERLPGFEQYYDNPGAITHRYTIWCISNTGPFRAFLHKIGLADEPSCRYCGHDSETSYHLVNECEYTRRSTTESTESTKSTIDGLCFQIVNNLLNFS